MDPFSDLSQNPEMVQEEFVRATRIGKPAEPRPGHLSACVHARVNGPGRASCDPKGVGMRSRPAKTDRRGTSTAPSANACSRNLLSWWSDELMHRLESS